MNPIQSWLTTMGLVLEEGLEKDLEGHVYNILVFHGI